MPLCKVWNQLVCHDFVVRSAQFNRLFWDYSRIPQLVFGLISTGLLDASHLNSVTNLRAQQARLVKNNCRFFRCLSRIHKTHMCLCKSLESICLSLFCGSFGTIQTTVLGLFTDFATGIWSDFNKSS